MAMTNLLALPLLAAAQAQKHVTLNEALTLLDGLVQIAVIELGRNVPPDAPKPGERYVVGLSPSGAFLGKAGMLASFDGTAWTYTNLQVGFVIYVMNEGQLYVHDGTRLKNVKDILGAPDSFARMGVGTGADANNVLSVKGTSALFAALATGNGGAGDFRLILNKDAAKNTASQIFQTSWSGRAETGLSGDESYRIKVSPDGNAWFESLAVDNSNGAIRFPSGIAGIGGGCLGYRNLVLNPDGAIAQRGNGPYSLAGAGPVAAFDRWRLIGGAGVAAILARTPMSAASIGAFQSGNYLTWTVTTATASARAILETRLDQFYALAGKRVTLSFRYRASAALAVTIVQNFGAGGSPSVATSLSVALSIATSWRAIAFDLVLPGISGKNIGPAPFLSLQFSTTQAVTFDCADLQFEEGYQTPFEQRPAALELILCRRFFRRSSIALNLSDLALEMRAAPMGTGSGPFDYDAEFEVA